MYSNVTVPSALLHKYVKQKVSLPLCICHSVFAICITWYCTQIRQTESIFALAYLLLHICYYILLYTRYDVKHCHYYVMCWFVACVQHSVLPRTRVCNGCVYVASETNKKTVVIVFNCLNHGGY